MKFEATCAHFCLLLLIIIHEPKNETLLKWFRESCFGFFFRLKSKFLRLNDFRVFCLCAWRSREHVVLNVYQEKTQIYLPSVINNSNDARHGRQRWRCSHKGQIQLIDLRGATHKKSFRIFPLLSALIGSLLSRETKFFCSIWLLCN